MRRPALLRFTSPFAVLRLAGLGAVQAPTRERHGGARSTRARGRVDRRWHAGALRV